MLLEKEREHLAYELHEEFGPSFSYLKMNINHLKRTTTDAETLTASGNHIDDMVKKVRDLAFQLLPPTFMRFGLATVLQQLIDHVTTDSTLNIRLAIADDVPKLNDHRGINIYRIIQEIVYNTVKHAKASLLLIELKKESDQLLLITKDDGTGFDYPQALEAEESGGLKSIVNRVQIMSGTVQVISRKGKGTIYMIIIPL